MLKRLSTAAVAAVVAIGGLGACVDAKKRFDEYDDRVPVVDASTVDRPAIPISNIDGTWYLAVSAVGTNLHLFVTWDVEVTGVTGTLDGTYQPLSAFGEDPPQRRVVGSPIIANDVVVDDTASFAAPLSGEIDGQANPISGSDLFPETPDTKLMGVIKTADLVCGTVTGAICVGGPQPCGGNGEPARLPLNGATFAAVRVTDVNSLPPLPPMNACPE
jgi:hypothetical protein